jgi:hypothetical protein
LIPNHSLKSQINQWREEQVWLSSHMFCICCSVFVWQHVRSGLGVNNFRSSLKVQITSAIAKTKMTLEFYSSANVQGSSLLANLNFHCRISAKNCRNQTKIGEPLKTLLTLIVLWSLQALTFA